ncbi:FAD-binding monooxygenase [Raphidocelis subcapitata]|uniref:FAD-binding monooxygenase n=1 Tax=Raphidocelis subcapitata TaxID=307507 RepID=A0A2V0P150_9CHLO|nr:FAD-binding monooxygenase [Raphidocelis subcapitata]|eukprot:GBF90815.1 FAD-binding monooxygenase [Raphidocelis subcapitata]
MRRRAPAPGGPAAHPPARRAPLPRRPSPPAAAPAAGAEAAPAAAPSADAAAPAPAAAVIVGGGPAGLAAALQLASRGWSDVVVLERRGSVEHADTDLSYVYNIDARGRRLLERHGLAADLEAAGVSTAVVDVTRVFPDGRKEQRQQSVKDPTRHTHWLPRPAFVRILANALGRPPFSSRVRVITGASVTAVRRSNTPGGGVVVEYEAPGGARAALRPALLLGCDGVDSSVRAALEGWADADPRLRAAAGSFSPRRVPCPSAGLRFKVLQLPPRPALRDGSALENSGFALLQGRPSAALGRGAAAIRLGLLPFAEPDAPRTANLITREGHPIWEVADGEAMYSVLSESLPQADWRALVAPADMARFAASRGGAFPEPTHPDGAGAAVDGAAVLLLGDALHCFPPDLGQGVNSALLDVLALDESLSAAAKPKTEGGEAAAGEGREAALPEAVDLAAAAEDYHRRQLPQAEALCKLLPLGFPYQYSAGPRRTLWNFVFLAQLALSRALPWLMPPPTFMMVQDAGMDYVSILARVRRAQLVGRAILAALALAAASLVLRLARAGAGAA